MTGALSLFTTAAMPVIQAGLLAGVGGIMAWTGVLRKPEGTSTVASLCFHCYTPSLTFHTLAQSITLQSIRSLWPLLLNMALSNLLGLPFGYATAWALRVPRTHRNLVVSAVAFGNIGNLPLVFVYTACSERGSIFQKVLGESCTRLGVSYVACCICVATLFQFTIALYLLRNPSNNHTSQSADEAMDTTGNGGCSGWVELAAPPRRLTKRLTISDLMQESTSPTPHFVTNDTENEHALVSTVVEVQPLLPSATTTTTAGGGSQYGVQMNVEDAHENWRQINLLWIRIKKPIVTITWLRNIEWKNAFPIPTQAAIAGIIVGCTPSLRGLFYGASPPLKFITETLEFLASGLIPSAMPLLGAMLFGSRTTSRLPAHIVAGTVMSRLLIQPLYFTGALWLLLHAGWLPSEDPMFLLILFLVHTTPSAINLITATVLYDYGAGEMSQILFWQYLLSLFTLPLFMWVFLGIIDVYMGGPL